jgi:hypothetical protein
MANRVTISAAVEGIVDEAVARRLIVFAGAIPGPAYGKQGKPFLQQRIRGYNAAARHVPWIVLVDLDADHECAPSLRASWLPQAAELLCFRIAVRAVEAWLLADAERIAAFLRIARSKIPSNPEVLGNPKTAMVALARASKQRDIRDDMVPRDESGRPVGPAYASRLIEFASSSWRPEVAAQRAESLRRAIDCLKRLARRG